MNYSLFHLIHLLAIFSLVAVAVYAFARPVPEVRKKALMWSGIASLVVFLSGFGLLGILKAGVPVWAVVKAACWLFLSVVVGLAFRKPEKSRDLLLASGLVVAVALVMVVFKPF